MPKAYHNPPTLFDSQPYGFSQIATASGGTTVFLSGQVGRDAQQQIVDPADLGAQARESLENIATAL